VGVFVFFFFFAGKFSHHTYQNKNKNIFLGTTGFFLAKIVIAKKEGNLFLKTNCHYFF
jgi:hypothetical protein